MSNLEELIRIIRGFTPKQLERLSKSVGMIIAMREDKEYLIMWRSEE